MWDELLDGGSNPATEKPEITEEVLEEEKAEISVKKESQDGCQEQEADTTQPGEQYEGVDTTVNTTECVSLEENNSPLPTATLSPSKLPKYNVKRK